MPLPLPLLISVPHAGLDIPAEVAPISALTAEEIAHDGDEGARAIYAIESDVAAFATTGVARAFVDVNRAEDDRRKDGVVKTHTCWDVPVYRTVLSEALVQELLMKYHQPFHQRLSQLASPTLRLAIDCHTMAAVGPPVAPDPSVERPWVCLSNADGTCPSEWIGELKSCFELAFGPHVTINHPFKGGYITRTHAAEMPWVQLELSRAPFLTDQEKKAGVLHALHTWVDRIVVPAEASALS